MWEVHGLWTWLPALYSDFLEEESENGLGEGMGESDRKRLASLVTFGVVGTAVISCPFVGWIGARWQYIVVPFAQRFS